MNKKKIKKTGFTLIEIIIILFIASIGIISSLSLAVRSAYFQNVKKDLITAVFLSTEGLELAKNVRDTNIINDLDYDDWLGEGSVGMGERIYTIDYNSLSFSDIGTSKQDLFINNAGLYWHTNEGEESIFDRLITITAEGEDWEDYSIIESWVSWKNRGNTYDFKLQTILYDLSL